MLQLRTTNSGDSRMYAPNRDLAYCFANLVKVALYSMTEESWKAEPWWGQYLTDHGTTMQDLCDVAEAMANSFKNFIDKDITTPYEALNKAGFFNTPTPAQLAVCAKIGQVCIGAYFSSLRDILHENDGPPVSILDLEKAGREVANLLKVKDKNEKSGDDFSSSDNYAYFGM